jgi:hypothetical protein
LTKVADRNSGERAQVRYNRTGAIRAKTFTSHLASGTRWQISAIRTAHAANVTMPSSALALAANPASGWRWTAQPSRPFPLLLATKNVRAVISLDMAIFLPVTARPRTDRQRRATFRGLRTADWPGIGHFGY